MILQIKYYHTNHTFMMMMCSPYLLLRTIFVISTTLSHYSTTTHGFISSYNTARHYAIETYQPLLLSSSSILGYRATRKRLDLVPTYAKGWQLNRSSSMSQYVHSSSSYLMNHRICQTNVNNIQSRNDKEQYDTTTSTAISMSNAEYIPQQDDYDSSRPSIHNHDEKLNHIQRIFTISDLHVDNISNMQWIQDQITRHPSQEALPGPNDAIIIAGDISHEISKLNTTLSTLRQNLHNCTIFFIFGNHEAWTLGGNELDSLNLTTSLQKLKVVTSLCEDLGVYTTCHLVGNNYGYPTWIMPLQSWYDGSLALEGCEDLCENFEKWPWVDFIRCVWPDSKDELFHRNNTTIGSESTYIPSNSNIHLNHNTRDDKNGLETVKNNRENSHSNNGRIPIGLNQYFLNQNEEAIQYVRDFYIQAMMAIDDDITSNQKNKRHNPIPSQQQQQQLPGLITFTHFLPNQKTLPDWKIPSSTHFLRDEWLDHPVPEISAKFAKVAGSSLIDDQIRSIIPKQQQESEQLTITHPKSSNTNTAVAASSHLNFSIRHLHVFGHSHRPKDFEYNGIRYIHNPLGKPSEREMNLISNNVTFQLIWDCRGGTNTSSRYTTKNNERRSNDVIFNNENESTMNYCKNYTSNDIKYISPSSNESSYYNRQTLSGEVCGETIIRYWEEHGGGLDLLTSNMNRRKNYRYRGDNNNNNNSESKIE